MGPDDYETIAAVALEDPERIGMMVSSTPTGARGMFYRICMELKFNQDSLVNPVNTNKYGYIYDSRNYDRRKAKGWKEFYFPGTVNPNWNARMEEEFRQEYTEVKYQHEVLAEFGTETQGVFNKSYVDEASSIEYPLQDKRVKEGPIAIGIDWDRIFVPSLSN